MTEYQAQMDWLYVQEQAGLITEEQYHEIAGKLHRLAWPHLYEL